MLNTPKETLACVVSPNAADAELAVSLLEQAGVRARAFASAREFAWALNDAVGCLILVEEAFLADDIPALRDDATLETRVCGCSTRMLLAAPRLRAAIEGPPEKLQGALADPAMGDYVKAKTVSVMLQCMGNVFDGIVEGRR